MAKVVPYSQEDGFSNNGWAINCPGCNRRHYIPDNGIWKFNGNVDRPTFKPSVNESCNAPGPKHQPGIPYSRCHFIITDGMIQFCADCTHNHAGETLPMLDIVLQQS